jgi:hypothetical protein
MQTHDWPHTASCMLTFCATMSLGSLEERRPSECAICVGRSPDIGPATRLLQDPLPESALLWPDGAACMCAADELCSVLSVLWVQAARSCKSCHTSLANIGAQQQDDINHSAACALTVCQQVVLHPILRINQSRTVRPCGPCLLDQRCCASILVNCRANSMHGCQRGGCDIVQQLSSVSIQTLPDNCLSVIGKLAHAP